MEVERAAARSVGMSGVDMDGAAVGKMSAGLVALEGGTPELTAVGWLMPICRSAGGGGASNTADQSMGESAGLDAAREVGWALGPGWVAGVGWEAAAAGNAPTADCWLAAAFCELTAAEGGVIAGVGVFAADPLGAGKGADGG